MGKKIDWLARRGIPFVQDEVSGLAELMTNVDKPVFAFTDKMPPEVAAALFSRYSRSPRSLRLVYAREFANENKQAARSFFERVLAEYGDDSVAQLGVVYLAVEMASVLATKDIEDGRLAAYIEKSTRYVDFSQKYADHYLYFEPPELQKSGLLREYRQVMDEAFELYGQLTQTTRNLVQQTFPRDPKTDEKVYLASIRAKAFDIVRCLLPMSTLTNTGMTLSAHAAETMLNKMLVNPLWETRKLAEEIKTEIDKVIPSLVSRVGHANYGGRMRDYLSQATSQTKKMAKRYLKKNTYPTQRVKLIWHTDQNLNRVVDNILYPYGQGKIKTSLKLADKKKIIDAYLSGRSDRRHKPGRAFEMAEYEFEFCDIVGAWKDLQRHRMLSQSRQLLTTELGFDLPSELQNDQKLKAHLQKRSQLFKKIAKQISPEVAQYVVGHGHKMSWRFKVNLRELYHLIPLRASAAGHPAYRRLSREMFYEIAKVDPILAMPMKRFIDFSDEPRLERLKQLEKVKQKLDKLGGKGGDTFI